jgi:hypothetical protein
MCFSCRLAIVMCLCIRYQALWAECKAKGKIDVPAADPHQITPDTPLRDILAIMQAKGEKAEREQKKDGFLHKVRNCVASARVFFF